jgi:hypothetical protein
MAAIWNSEIKRQKFLKYLLFYVHTTWQLALPNLEPQTTFAYIVHNSANG